MATTQLELWDPRSLRAEHPTRAERPSSRVKAPKPSPDPEASGGNPSDPPPSAPRHSLLDSLRERVSRIETGGRDEPMGRFSCGSAVLDRMLPGGGLAPGTINEWIGQSEGCGAGWLSLLAARSALAIRAAMAARGAGSRSSAGGRFVVIDTDGSFYPPATIAAGIPAEQTIVVRPGGSADFLWAADQALRSPAVAVVWGVLEKIDDRNARRLQLAAETGDSLGMFIRPRQALREPSWAEVRWHVRGMPGCGTRRFGIRRLEARLVRCRGGRSGGSAVLEIDSAGQLHHEPDHRHASPPTKAAAVPLAAQLARPAAAQLDRRRRA